MIVLPGKTSSWASGEITWLHEEDFNSLGTSALTSLGNWSRVNQIGTGQIVGDGSGNLIVTPTTFDGERVEESTVLADDQRAEIDVVAGGAGDVAVGVLLRVTSEDFYQFSYFESGATTELKIQKSVAGSVGSALAIDTSARTAPYTLRAEARDNGANVDLELFIDGVSIITATDTTSVHTSGTAGMIIYTDSVIGQEVTNYRSGNI